MKPVAILIHVMDVSGAFLWYQEAFGNSSVKPVSDCVPPTLVLDGIEIEFVTADRKVQSGMAGTVVYWAVESVIKEIERFESLGATIYRGPLAIENDELMCQIKDPFDNLFGLRGRA